MMTVNYWIAASRGEAGLMSSFNDTWCFCKHCFTLCFEFKAIFIEYLRDLSSSVSKIGLHGFQISLYLEF